MLVAKLERSVLACKGGSISSNMVSTVDEDDHGNRLLTSREDGLRYRQKPCSRVPAERIDVTASDTGLTSSMSQKIERITAGREKAVTARACWKEVARNVREHLQQIVDDAESNHGTSLSLQMRETSSSDVIIVFGFGKNLSGLRRTNSDGSMELQVEDGACIQFSPCLSGTIVVTYYDWGFRWRDESERSQYSEQLARERPEVLNDSKRLRELVEEFFTLASDRHWSQPATRTRDPQ